MLEKVPELEQAIQMLKSHEAIQENNRDRNNSDQNVDKVSRRYKKKPSHREDNKSGFGN